MLNKKKKSTLFLLVFVILSMISCNTPNRETSIKWSDIKRFRAELILDAEKNIRLPFLCNQNYNSETGAYTWEILNGEEKILVDEITVDDTKFIIKLPVFDSEIIAQVDDDGIMRGTWINHARKDMNIIAFEASAEKEYRFFPNEKNANNSDFNGKWETTFSQSTELEYKAVGIFLQTENKAIGTFLTETGDYRYLEGNVKRDTLYLSCFDGSHAYLFKAVKKSDGTIDGDFWAGIHHHEKWVAKRNASFELPGSDTIVKAVSEKKVDFTFPNLDSVLITLSDEQYKNKAVIIQLMGSWCPNCMDETAYLSELHKRTDTNKLAIVALCFEKSTDFATAKKNVERLKNRYKANYDFLIAGSASKKEAAEKLPWLSTVVSFPTTILVNPKHEIVKIYSGFNGPATGQYYSDFKILFETELEKLVNNTTN